MYVDHHKSLQGHSDDDTREFKFLDLEAGVIKAGYDTVY
jgi:hypothetical protein